MTDVVLNLNSCAERAIFSQLLSNCVYIIKHGLLSPELFVRRVQKRQSKRLRKKGVNMNAKGCEYAVAENILHHLKTLSSPLVPWNLYQQLRGLLDVYTPQSRSAIITEAFKSIDTSTVYVFQAVLKTLHLMTCFESGTVCPECGRTLEGNEISQTMVSVPITSYLLRERVEGGGHWFMTWGQQASDVAVVKILAQHWRDVGNNGVIPDTSLPTLTKWYCHVMNGCHGAEEPREIPVLEVDHLISPLTFKQPPEPKPSSDFEITLYKVPLDFQQSDDIISDMKSLETLDTLYEKNVQTLKALQCQLEERRKNDGRSRAERKAATLDLVKWILKSQEKDVDNIWRPAEEELNLEGDQEADHVEINSAILEVMSGNVLAGCGSGSWDMWGSCTNPPEEPLAESYWTKEELSLDISVSRIISLLNQPSLKRLEALANRLAPIITTKSVAMTTAPSFRKPLHLVKEFVPRSERNKTSAVRSIDLIFPPSGLTTENLAGVHLKPISIQSSTLVGRPVQPVRPFPMFHVPAQNFNTHIPPLPKELVHETPPNLSTIKVLSQLFNTY